MGLGNHAAHYFICEGQRVHYTLRGFIRAHVAGNWTLRLLENREDTRSQAEKIQRALSDQLSLTIYLGDR
jgi:hypothetical protein